MASYNVNYSKIQKLVEAVKKPSEPIVIPRNKLDIMAIKVTEVKRKIKYLLCLIAVESIAIVYLTYRSF